MTMGNDLRVAVRMLVRDRALTFAAVAVLALGIAANNTVFTIVNAAVLRDLPFDQPERIVEIGTIVPRGNRGVSYLDLLDWRERTRTFEGLAGFGQQTMNVSDDEHAPERFDGAYISANAFALIGHQPVLGRNFTADDERPGAPPVVVLGDSVWKTRYQSDRAVVGRTIRVNGVPSAVIGVMAEGFKFPMLAEVWQPLPLLPAEALKRDVRFLGAVGRLRADATLDQARDDLRIVMGDLAREYPATNADVQPRVVQFRWGIGPQITIVVYALLGAVAFVLLIACANVANLLLARAADRIREMSVRLAIGASRWHIVRQLLIESLLLASAAGVIGFALSLVGIRLFTNAATGTGEPYWLHFTIDLRVFGFFAVVLLGTAVVFGLAPALHASRLSIRDTLNESGRAAAGALRARRWAGALVILQLTLAPVLLTGAGLMVRTFLAEYNADPGITTAGLLRMRLNLTSQAYPTPERRAQFYRQLEERLASSSNLRAALAHAAPLEGATPREVSFDGRPDVDSSTRRVSTITIGLRYFETLDVPILRGRDFLASDVGTGNAPAIVNERLAALHFPDGDAIGRRIWFKANPERDATEPDSVTIVGIVPNVRQRGTEPFDFDPIVYLPYAFNPLSWTSVLVRTESDLSLVTAQLREHVRALDPDLPLFDVVTIDDLLTRELWATRIFGVMFSVFAMIALVTATIGLYAVTARSVAQRTREIGIRTALGAQAGQIWWLVTRRVSLHVAIGLALGITGAMALARLLQGVLFRASPTDPVTLFGVTALLVVVGVGASLAPARRAMRLDPVVALRHE
jgi:putative ABC transport system permease protein